jgi:hypothetical protein
MTSEQMTLLPTELTAKFLYLCKNPTINGTQQAKCSFLHDGKEYMGILFTPDGEEWFEKVAKDTLIKACRISPCDNERYPGEYKGTALPLNQQPLEVVYTPVKTESVVIDMSLMPVYLREAAATIEALLAASNKAPAEQTQEQVKKRLPYRSVPQWADVIIKIIRVNKTFQAKPFSALSFNGYLDHYFNDFWEGDLEVIKNGPRWRQQVSSTLRKLVDVKFIEHAPGAQKHYQLTAETLATPPESW